MEIMFNNVDFSYNSKNIFNNLNLKLDSNVITGVIGNGKTTLINLIIGDLKPNKGDITIGGGNNTFNIAYIPNIIDYNKTGYQILNSKTKSFDVDDILKIIDLDKDKLDKQLYLLIKNEISKILLGSVLIQDRDLLILDSIDSMLDYKTKSLLIKFLRSLKVRYGRTIIISSNDIDFIHSVCDEVVLLNDKPIVMDKYKIFNNEKLIKDSNIEIPKLIEISNLIYKKKNIKIGYRDDIKDLIKDMYRYAR